MANNLLITNLAGIAAVDAVTALLDVASNALLRIY